MSWGTNLPPVARGLYPAYDEMLDRALDAEKKLAEEKEALMLSIKETFDAEKERDEALWLVASRETDRQEAKRKAEAAEKERDLQKAYTSGWEERARKAESELEAAEAQPATQKEIIESAREVMRVLDAGTRDDIDFSRLRKALADLHAKERSEITG